MSPSSTGSGRLVVNVKGPVVETSKKPASNPHILIIIPDSRRVEILSPSRISEQHRDDDPQQKLLAVTYFWENLSVTFDKLEPGWHVVMLDTSLQDPRSHQSMMTGSRGQTENDWNGTVEIKAGKTTTVTFHQKDFLSGKFLSPRKSIR